MALASLSGCDWFDDPTPELIRVVIDGEAGTQLSLVTATDFLVTADEFGATTVRPTSADTTLVTLPLDSIFHIEGRFQFVLVGVPADSAATVPLQYDFRINDERSFGGQAEINLTTPLKFLMQFNQPTLAEFDLA